MFILAHTAAGQHYACEVRASLRAVANDTPHAPRAAHVHAMPKHGTNTGSRKGKAMPRSRLYSVYPKGTRSYANSSWTNPAGVVTTGTLLLTC